MLNKSNPVAQKQVSPNKGVVIASMAIILHLALYGLRVYSFVFGSLDPEEIVQAVIFALMFPIFSIGFGLVNLLQITCVVKIVNGAITNAYKQSVCNSMKYFSFCTIAWLDKVI